MEKYLCTHQLYNLASEIMGNDSEFSKQNIFLSSKCNTTIFSQIVKKFFVNILLTTQPSSY